MATPSETENTFRVSLSEREVSILVKLLFQAAEVPSDITADEASDLIEKFLLVLGA